jgi:hypothetical protein
MGNYYKAFRLPNTVSHVLITANTLRGMFDKELLMLRRNRKGFNEETPEKSHSIYKTNNACRAKCQEKRTVTRSDEVKTCHVPR